MAMVICPQGHQYDDNRYTRCPYCGITLGKKASPRKKMRFGRRGVDEDAPTQAQRSMLDGVTQRRQDAAADDDVKTVGVFEKKFDGQPVVGWLVCVNGPQRGRDHRLHSGRNRIGRSPLMDVMLPEDADVHMDMHAELIFDPASARYALMDAEGDISCNGKAVHGYVDLKDGDHIAIGGSEMVFIAFCREGRQW